LAEGLHGIRGIKVDPAVVETNMVFAELPFSGAESVARLASVGVQVNAEGRTPDTVRFVCHLDIARADVDEALTRVQRAVSAA
jgi:threonine aldolase